MSSRAERLNTRFKIIQQTLEELYGRERAFGAASAAWLMALQYTHKQSLLHVLQRWEDDDGLADWQRKDMESVISNLENEMESLLQSFHAEMCEHLNVDQTEAWQHATAFKQVIDDICHQGG